MCYIQAVLYRGLNVGADLSLVLVVESLLHVGLPVDGHIGLSCRDKGSVSYADTLTTGCDIV